MIPERPDSLPQWNHPAGSSAGPPRGLFEELIKEGALVKDLVMPAGTFRVQTRIHCDPKACFFRSSVSCNGEEIREQPWAPIFQNLAEEMVGREGDPATRHDVARRALETHLALCARVGQALETRSFLVPQVREGLRPQLVAVAFSITCALIGAWYFWWSRRTNENAVVSPPVVVDAPTGLGEDPIPSGAESAPASEPVTPEGAGGEGLTATHSSSTAPSGSAPRTSKSKGERASAPTATPKKPTAVPRGEERSVGRAAPPPTGDAPTARSEQEGKRSRRWPIAATLSPKDFFTPKLVAGNKLYLDDEIRLTGIPPAYQGMQCVTTSASSGDTKQGIVITLSEPATVIIAHDQDVKRRPDWLDGFLQTGESLRAMVPGEPGGGAQYLLFQKDFPAGTLNLGANTGARGLVRMSKRLSGRHTFMYLVCAPEIYDSN